MESKHSMHNIEGKDLSKISVLDFVRVPDSKSQSGTEVERIPAGLFLSIGLGAMGASLFFKAIGLNKTANFVGLLTPTVLILGLYNKLLKLENSDMVKISINVDDGSQSFLNQR